jgi:hypothetical protein
VTSSVAYAAAALAVIAGDICLLLACWRSQTILAGVCAAAGIPLVGFAVLSGISTSTGEAALIIALGALVIGIALFGLVQVLQRLLDSEPREGL